MALGHWKFEEHETLIRLSSYDNEHVLPKFQVTIYSSLKFRINIFGWSLIISHPLYTQNEQSVKFLSLRYLLDTLDSFILCGGVPKESCAVKTVEDPTGSHNSGKNIIVRHTIPVFQEPQEDLTTDVECLPFKVSLFFRTERCEMLCPPCIQICNSCSIANAKCISELKKKNSTSTTSLPIKAPLSASSAPRLAATISKQRLHCKQLEQRIKKIEEISTHGIKLSDNLEEDITSIIGKNSMECSPHMKLFWEEQKKHCAANPKGRRYHPQFVRFCLSLHAKSSSAYRELQEVLVLPSERTLINYKNIFTPKPGIHNGKIQQLQDLVSSYSGCERYVVVAFDEMKIKSSLVFQKNTGEIVGFTDLGDPELTFSSFDNELPVATTAIAFLVRGLMTSLKFILCYFCTSGAATSFQIFTLFWQVVAVLELKVNIWCVAAIADGAATNRKFFKLHKGLQDASYTGVIYYTVNLFAPQRKIYFFSDVPHLIKTSRNCLYSSGRRVGDVHTRCMWNDDKYLLWSFVAQVYYRDQEGAIQHLPKITLDHIKVNYAIQVFSKSMANALRYFNPNGEADELAKFIGMVNDFFDMANVRSVKEHIHKKIPT